MLVGYCVKTVMVVILYIYMWQVNKKRDRDAGASTEGTFSTEDERKAIDQGMHDVTELDNPGFRYSL
jgi:hypothetical protein